MLPALTDIIDLFESVDGIAKLELLVEFGERLSPLSEPYRALRDSGLHMIHECQSPVFLFVAIENGMIRIHADVPREAPIARGFVALVQETFDGVSLDEIKDVHADLLLACGIKDLLTFQRRRGLSSVYREFLLAAGRSTRKP